MVKSLVRYFSLSAVVVCVSEPGMAQEMPHHEITSECTQTIQRAAIFLDRLDAEKYSDLFVQEGVIVINDNATEGRDAIAERVRTADRSELDIHFTGSIVVDVAESESISATSYAIIYEGERPDTPGRVPVLEYLVADYEDQMRMTDAGCKFVRREVRIIFSSER